MNRTCGNQQMQCGNSRMMRQGQCPADQRRSENMMRREQRMTENMPCREQRMTENMPCREQRMTENMPCREQRMTENMLRREQRMPGNMLRHDMEHGTQEIARTSDMPTGSRMQLLCFINEVSFAVYEALLYLDTHPDDQEAMCFFKEHNEKRERALKEYARMYGPLTISTADDAASSSWEWMCQPWPWEGGDC